MKKVLKYLFILCLLTGFCYADNVFNHPITTKILESNMVELDSISCKFTQNKTLSGTTLKSGGNFKFIKGEGVIFDTLYPVKTSVSYTASSSKQINSIITGIANKNYSYINKNFQLYYINNDVWNLGLKPKQSSDISRYLDYITIKGNKKYIENLNIVLKNGDSTNINIDCR